MIIGVDVDGTVADLHTEWLRMYNEDFYDKLKPSDIIRYDVREFVRPSARIEIYKYLSYPSLYNDVKPIQDALWGVNQLKKLGHRIVYATAAISSPGRKFWWLAEHGFLKANEHYNYLEIVDKGLLNTDILIDDSEEQISKFRGHGILFGAPWNNSNLDWKRIVAELDHEC